MCGRSSKSWKGEVLLGVKRYVHDFQPGEQGYEYVGKWYCLSAGREEAKRQVLFDAAELTVISLLFFVGLMRNNAGSYVFWILIPYVSLFLPAAFGWMGAFALARVLKKQETDDTARRKFTDGKREGVGQRKDSREEILLRQMDFDRGIRRLWRCGLGLSILSGMAAAANGLLVFSRWSELEIKNEIFFLCASIGIFAVSLLFLKQNRKMIKKVRMFKE